VSGGIVDRRVRCRWYPEYVGGTHKKWIGAIDHLVTTDHFLQAIDLDGREVWKKRFDPKDTSTLEPLVATLNSRAVIVLSAGRRILCFEPGGAQLWDLPLWHHPGTVTAVDRSGGGAGMLLAAAAPRKDIVGIDGAGKLTGRGEWVMARGHSAS
jgi:hypothetical protein